MTKVLGQYRGWTIRQSGMQFVKARKEGHLANRYISIEAAKACIDSIEENRVMTPEEHAKVYSR